MFDNLGEVPVVEQILDAARANAAGDPHDVPRSLWLQNAEQLIVTRNIIDAMLAGQVQIGDSTNITVIECGRQTTSWLVEDQQLARGDAKQLVWVARYLPYYPAIREAFLAGLINRDHVRVMIGCLQKLPGDWAASCEAEMLEFAKHYDPGLLANLCQELRIRSGADEDAEAAAARRHADRHVSLDETFDGMFSVNGLLDPVAGACLRAALDALMTRHGPEDTRTTDQARADALAELAELGLSFGKLPDVGGERPTVAITITFQEILDGIPATHLSSATLNGASITASTARMIACDSHILPVVLGGDSEVLDLGRTRRHFTRAQRRALRITDGGCAWPAGCQAPLWRCQIHHVKEWIEHHGPTDLANGIHLCRFHHWLIHHSDWNLWRDESGKTYAAREPDPTDKHFRQPGEPDPWDDPDPPPKT